MRGANECDGLLGERAGQGDVFRRFDRANFDLGWVQNPKHFLRLENAPHRIIQLLLRDFAIPHGLHKVGKGFAVHGVVAVEEQQICASRQRQRSANRRRCAVGSQCAHFERVGHNQSIVAEFFAQKSSQRGARERGRHARCGVNGGEGDVRRHHARHTCCNCGAEGGKFNLVEAGAVMRHERQVYMRIHAGIAVTWEVLAKCQHATFLQALSVG